MPAYVPNLARSRRLAAGLGTLVLVVAGCSGGGTATSAPPSARASSPAAPAVTAPAPSAPATSAAATTGIMGRGRFHDVDGTATGEAQLLVKPDGVYEVVLEEFEIDSIAHTNVVLVSNADVTKTADVDKSKLLDLGPLKAPKGMQDFVIPAEMASSVMEGYHAVVLWDTEMAHAIAAAPLK